MLQGYIKGYILAGMAHHRRLPEEVMFRLWPKWCIGVPKQNQTRALSAGVIADGAGAQRMRRSREEEEDELGS